MIEDEEINNQLRILAAERRTLTILLEQRAKLSQPYSPPGLINGIRESRERIRRIKYTLRGWGASIDDYPYEDETEISLGPVYTGGRQRPRISKTVGIPIAALLVVVIVALIFGIIGRLRSISTPLPTITPVSPVLASEETTPTSPIKGALTATQSSPIPVVTTPNTPLPEESLEPQVTTIRVGIPPDRKRLRLAVVVMQTATDAHMEDLYRLLPSNLEKGDVVTEATLVINAQADPNSEIQYLNDWENEEQEARNLSDIVILPNSQDLEIRITPKDPLFLGDLFLLHDAQADQSKYIVVIDLCYSSEDCPINRR